MHLWRAMQAHEEQASPFRSAVSVCSAIAYTDSRAKSGQKAGLPLAALAVRNLPVAQEAEDCKDVVHLVDDWSARQAPPATQHTTVMLHWLHSGSISGDRPGCAVVERLLAVEAGISVFRSAIITFPSMTSSMHALGWSANFKDDQRHITRHIDLLVENIFCFQKMCVPVHGLQSTCSLADERSAIADHMCLIQNAPACTRQYVKYVGGHG